MPLLEPLRLMFNSYCSNIWHKRSGKKSSNILTREKKEQNVKTCIRLDYMHIYIVFVRWNVQHLVSLDKIKPIAELLILIDANLILYSCRTVIVRNIIKQLHCIVHTYKVDACIILDYKICAHSLFKLNYTNNTVVWR